MAKSKKVDVTIEQKLTSIDKIIGKLEAGEISLEDSLKLFADGTELINDCRGILDTASQEINTIVEKNDRNE